MVPGLTMKNKGSPRSLRVLVLSLMGQGSPMGG